MSDLIQFRVYVRFTALCLITWADIQDWRSPGGQFPVRYSERVSPFQMG
jgi:hypothetical protein